MRVSRPNRRREVLEVPGFSRAPMGSSCENSLRGRTDRTEKVARACPGGCADLFWRRQALFLLLLAFLLGLRVAASHWAPPRPPRADSGWGQEQRAFSTGGQQPIRGDRAIHRGRKSPPSHPLDINRATREELMSLPGIGPVLAGRIVSYREERGPFTDISEIIEVNGIGQKRFERIEPWIQVGNGKR